MSSTIKAALSTMPGANAMDRLCESKAVRTVGKYLAVAAVTALVAAAVLAIVAVSIPTAGAPAWIAGAAAFFGSFSAPSLFGLVIPVKAVVYAWASLTLLLAGCLGLVAAKPDDEVEWVKPTKRQLRKQEERYALYYFSDACLRDLGQEFNMTKVNALLQRASTNNVLKSDIVHARKMLGEAPFPDEFFTRFYPNG